jgi:hypothetical protein
VFIGLGAKLATYKPNILATLETNMSSDYMYGVGLALLWLGAFVWGVYVGWKRLADWIERAALAEIDADDRTANTDVDFDVRVNTVVQCFVLKEFEVELDEDETPLTERTAPLIIGFQRRSKSAFTLTWNICLYIVLMPFGSVAYSVGLGCMDNQAKRIEFMVEE